MIYLTDDELAHYHGIVERSSDDADWAFMGIEVDAFLRLILERVPACRWKAFFDPAYHTSGQGNVAKVVQERARSRNRTLVGNPYFVKKWLRYFVEGPDLPISATLELSGAIVRATQSGQVSTPTPLLDAVTVITTRHPDIDPEQIFLAAIEHEPRMDVATAAAMRRAAMKTKRR